MARQQKGRESKREGVEKWVALESASTMAIQTDRQTDRADGASVDRQTNTFVCMQEELLEILMAVELKCRKNYC